MGIWIRRPRPPLRTPSRRRTATAFSLQMVAVTAENACLLTQIVNMMFMTGMCFFPEKMMEAYKAETFTGEGKTLFIYFFGLMGIMMGHAASVNATMRLPTAKKAARGVCCLGNAVGWTFFIILDGQLTFNLRIPGVINDIPSALPKDGMIANLVLFAVVAGVNYLGWKEAGSPMPNTSSLVPSGILATPLKLIIVDALFWGFGSCFAPSMMMDQYLPGVMGKAGKAQDMIWVILERIGFQSLLSTITTIMTLAAVPGDADTNYRITRSYIYRNMFFLGFISRDNVIKSCTRWSFPLQVTNFFQAFGITFYAASQLGAIDLTIKKGKSALIRPPPSSQTRVP